MSIFDPVSADIGRWLIGEGHGLCPDCDGTVAAGAISAHVDWHDGLHRGFFGGEPPPDTIVERCDPASGLVRLAHEFQIGALRMHDHR